MIPLASIFFTYTNTGKRAGAMTYQGTILTTPLVGAALWAADIEAHNTSMTEGTAPSLREHAVKDSEL